MVMWVVHERVKTNTQTGLQLTLARALINGSLSCMRPAVSTSTTSYPCCCAGKEAGVADQSHTHTPPLTKPYGLHGYTRCIFAIASLVQHDGGGTPFSGGLVEGVQVMGVGPQLLHRTRTEGIASSNQHTVTILQQPEGNLFATNSHKAVTFTSNLD